MYVSFLGVFVSFQISCDVTYHQIRSMTGEESDESCSCVFENCRQGHRRSFSVCYHVAFPHPTTMMHFCWVGLSYFWITPIYFSHHPGRIRILSCGGLKYQQQHHAFKVSQNISCDLCTTSHFFFFTTIMGRITIFSLSDCTHCQRIKSTLKSYEIRNLLDDSSLQTHRHVTACRSFDSATSLF